MRKMIAIGYSGLYLDPHAQPQIQVEFALKQAKMWLNDRFSVMTALTREKLMRIMDSRYIRQIFAVGCTGKDLDPHGQPHMQVQFAVKQARM
jgi:3-deoxy-D-arabino-heptulosonate 7-phosphate (DAHP) synthase